MPFKYLCTLHFYLFMKELSKPQRAEMSPVYWLKNTSWTKSSVRMIVSTVATQHIKLKKKKWKTKIQQRSVPPTHKNLNQKEKSFLMFFLYAIRRNVTFSHVNTDKYKCFYLLIRNDQGNQQLLWRAVGVKKIYCVRQTISSISGQKFVGSTPLYFTLSQQVCELEPALKCRLGAGVGWVRTRP